jgi:hypothetical protein
MEEKIMTLHPEAGKAGVNIDRQKYEMMRDIIVDIIALSGEFDFRDLPNAVGRRLNNSFDGSIGWYTTTVKLDLEARGIIERIPNSRPQRLRLAENRRN